MKLPRKKKKLYDRLLEGTVERKKREVVGRDLPAGHVLKAGMDAYGEFERRAKESGLGKALLDRRYFVLSRMKALKRSRGVAKRAQLSRSNAASTLP